MRIPLRWVFVIGLLCAAEAPADDAAAPPTQHQMMKDCMAKQKASDGGMPKEDMKKACRDVTKTEKENAKTDNAKTNKESSEPAASPPQT